MSERCPEYHAPGRERNRTELAKDYVCAAKVKFVVESEVRLRDGNSAMVSGILSCDNCLIFGNSTQEDLTLESARLKVLDELRNVVKEKCPMWKMKDNFERNPMTDSFLPSQLQL